MSTCPACGWPVRSVETRYGTRRSCEPCGLWAWGDAPLVDEATHEARKAAHEAFDSLWKTGEMSRGRAYKLLSKKLGRQAHMKEMSAEEALKVPGWVAEIRALAATPGRC